MLLCIFLVGVGLLLFAGKLEDNRNKKLQNMSLEEYKEYWRTGELPK